MTLSFIKTLVDSRTANQYAVDNMGRYNAPILAIVTANNDPDGKRRVKVSDPACPSLETDFIRALRPYPQLDPPIPEIGSTVLVFFVDGDPSNGFYMPVQNDTNPPLKKDDAVSDYRDNVPGNRRTETGGDRLDRVTDVYTIKVGQSFRLENDKGAYIELTAAGLIEIADAFGHKITLGAGGSNNLLEWDLGGASVRVKNASDFQLSTGNSGFKTVATIGSIDSRGDTTNTSGWQ